MTQYGRRSADAEVAELQSDYRHIAEDVKELKVMVAGLSSHLSSVQHQLSEFRGGGRTLLWVGGAIGGTVVSLLLWAAEHLLKAIK